ncbi:MAG: [acyl-carrier-protein] S-malonyltransferase [Alphaproteobacteria bacterium RIFCSPHIGHO2_12_FULL_63_12]|nr:MAG: [acyl-carrier-protein] S-malonyltransferase [Alphaproteobacteria bacterium RIFCSPHIGHO2_12_FULL_63_12]
MARCFVFPGQGSQTVGMGMALADAFPAAREVFEEVDDAVGRKLSKMMWEGPAEELNLTVNTQPALMAHSIAMLRVLEKEAGLDIADARFVAGHSLGEYSALCAARAISLADTARLLRLRGEAMQAAVAPGEGAMAALIGIDIAGAEKAIAETDAALGVCEIANDNAPGQVVVSGAKARVEATVEASKKHGAKMAKLLAVSAPFHSSLMAPAAEKMAEALAKTTIRTPVAPLVANVTAKEAGGPQDIRDLLVKQVTGRVRWTDSVAYMAANGADRFIEIGTGKVLSGLIKRIAKDAAIISVGEPADLDAYAKF